MICAYCGKPMEKGVLRSRDAAVWLPYEKRNALFGAAEFHKGAIELSGFSFLKGSTLVAYCCKACQKIVIDYATEQNAPPNA